MGGWREDAIEDIERSAAQGVSRSLIVCTKVSIITTHTCTFWYHGLSITGRKVFSRSKYRMTQLIGWGRSARSAESQIGQISSAVWNQSDRRYLVAEAVIPLESSQ